MFFRIVANLQKISSIFKWMYKWTHAIKTLLFKGQLYFLNIMFIDTLL